MQIRSAVRRGISERQDDGRYQFKRLYAVEGVPQRVTRKVSGPFSTSIFFPGTLVLISLGRPANSVQGSYGYKDHGVKLAEVRRNGAIPY